MNPGKELDALIAEKIMDGKSFTIGEDWSYPKYSTDISAARNKF